MAVTHQQVPILDPCPIELDRTAASAAERLMHCRHCRKDVHVLSHLTETEARALLAARAGQNICVSYAIRSDGQIRFREPISATIVSAAALVRERPVAGRRRSHAWTLGASAMLAACTAHGEPEPLGPLVADDPISTIDMPIIPEAPCDPAPDRMVDGGIRAAPVLEPEPERGEIEMRRGSVWAVPVDPAPEPERVVAGGLRAQPLEPPGGG